ncbi:redox-sensitive transcriptional activator SoxR [Gluconacetobacter sacchari]|uniref:Redox-sensitive transcriptional activator SoxR n=2 Tax=Gluconacetobacter sacchari TaxID=92759 RepID=A0A7W4IBK0_9PROT|nr:redox-sensitive transcriptional activator SoxR [Gluconacetobacter sacchari]MBB2159849.1 redox-sensitive transcriptional activator SoxR [Gluconacetobacter sacchari]GBQ28417.1 MerR family transcriptional regulator [Gluconacetobacter sacchari DSM 12717]
MRADDLSVGDVARRCGVRVSTLHFYEASGLIRSARNAGNQRRYGRAVLRRIAIIRVAQRAGLSLAEIRAALAGVPDDRAATVRDWRRMSKSWRAGLQERIDDLTRLRDQLDRCIGCGCLSLSDCPLRNPQDVLGAARSGPVLLG